MMYFRRGLATITTLVATGSILAACGSSSSSSSTVAKPPSTKTEISTAFATFFDGSSSATKKIALLQNGAEFTAVIKGEASSSIARSTSVKVSKVTVASPTAATVLYTIYLDGKAALKNQTGEAVKVDGSWKVGDSSFCGLISLEGAKVPACSALTKNS